VTKVLPRLRGASVAVAVWLLICSSAQSLASTALADAAAPRPAEALYLQLGHVGLDPARVYRVRGASIDRAEIHITLEDGTLAFTQDVMGRVTGAFFEGEGELLLVPPNDMERKSISLFTGMAILEERFATAYFRFNDDTAAEMKPDLRAVADGKEFVERWSETARNLAQTDAMRLLITFSEMLPSSGTVATPPQDSAQRVGSGDRMLHARLQGTKLGVFDIYFDSEAGEAVQAGQGRTAENGNTYYDVWTSFAPEVQNESAQNSENPAAHEKPWEDPVVVRRYVITTEVKPPKAIYAESRLQLDVKQGAGRALIFELSRFLNVEGVEMNGHPVEFIHNPAVEGTQLSRRVNDLVAVILPQTPHAGDKIELRFVYRGEVLAEAGGGLLYVGARGTWYPNRGLAMADFDLEFHYPPEWTLVATGKPSGTAATANGLQVGRWISERPLPVAGFNLGKYKVATARAGDVTVETYATVNVERDFPRAPMQMIESSPGERGALARRQQIAPMANPSPARNAVSVTEAAVHAIQFYADRFGPFPYSRVALTQMPGRESQGWPGLVFLSSYAFLDEEERQQLHFEPFRITLQQQIPAHEIAHQWWGDLITWRSYRDQWFSEGLANYCSLMMVQERNPAAFKELMERYREDLAEKNNDGVSPKDVGPVTLGARLLSSHSPQGYEAISYGRGTWLFHMLRTMLRDAAPQPAESNGANGGGSAEPFVRALRKVRQRYEGKSISTRELLDVFAEDLPPDLRFEGKKSLDWFLEGWVNGTALPRLELKAVKFTPKGAAIVVTGTIQQREAPEELVTSVPVYAMGSGKSLTLLGRVFADGRETSFELSAPAGTHKIVLDPNETILTSPK